MKCKFYYLIFPLFLFYHITVIAQVRKIDTSFKMSDKGYRVSCSNKNMYENIISVSTIGFKNTGSKSFATKGNVIKTEIANLNDDDNPELLMYVYGVPNAKTGTVICLTIVDNSLTPVFFPDIYDDPLLRTGYSGDDVFSVHDGILIRSFPLHKQGDANDTTTLNRKIIQYKMFLGGNGSLSFKILRSYESTQ